MTAELSAAVAAVKAISNQQTSVNQHSAFCETKCEQQKKAKICQSNWCGGRRRRASQSRKKKTTTPQRRRNYAKPKKIVNK